MEGAMRELEVLLLKAAAAIAAVTGIALAAVVGVLLELVSAVDGI